MSIEQTRDATKLLEDIELELASIKAATALRSLDRPPPPLGAPNPDPEQGLPAPRVIGAVDLAYGRAESGTPEAPEPSAPAPAAEPQAPKRRTLQERLASLADEDPA